MKKKLSFQINEGTLLGCIFLLFFCNSIYFSLLYRIVGRSFLQGASYIILFSAFLLIYLIKHGNDVVFPAFLFLCVSLLFFFTYLVHPEYEQWFKHQIYGYVPAILSPGSGIWAFLVIWMIKDEDRINHFLRIACWLLFMFLCLKFFMAQIRGSWIYVDISGETIQTEYDMEFGYEMVLPTAFMGANAFLTKKKGYYVPYVLGVAMILLGGSRGAVIWPILMFPLMLPYKWKNMTLRKRVLFLYFFIIIICILIAIAFRFKQFINLIAMLSSRVGLQSRTLNSILSGSFSDPNGRDEIYRMAIDLIKNGGPFGHGVYGDRYFIGTKFKWGYSHNIILELLVSFGYIGGTILCAIFVLGITKVYKACQNNIARQIVFISFFASMLKLMLSNSFWYSDAFWAILALMLMWNKKNTIKKLMPISWMSTEDEDYCIVK